MIMYLFKFILVIIVFLDLKDWFMHNKQMQRKAKSQNKVSTKMKSVASTEKTTNTKKKKSRFFETYNSKILCYFIYSTYE